MEESASKSKSGHIYDKAKSLLKNKDKGIYIWTRTHYTRRSHSINIEVPNPHEEKFVKGLEGLGGRWMKKDQVWSTSCDFETKIKVCKIIDDCYQTSLEEALLSHKEKTSKGLERYDQELNEKMKQFSYPK